MSSVYKAIKRGRLLLMYGPLIIMVVCIVPTMAIAFQHPSVEGIIYLFVFFLALILAFVFSWIWWSYWVVEWKIWAFQNVKDIHLLFERGISGKLIWPRGHWCEKTEFRFGKKKALLEQLGKRLDQPRETELVIDESLPEEYYIGVTKYALGWAFGLFIAAILVLIFITYLYFISIVLLILSGVSYWVYAKELRKGAVFIRLNSNHIFIRDGELEIYWEDITKFSVIHEVHKGNSSNGNELKIFLILETKLKKSPYQKIDLHKAGISRLKLEYLMDVYHSRWVSRRRKINP